MIPYGKQDITQEDIDSVVEVLQSDFLTQGPRVPQFESIIKSAVQADYAVASNSATSALHIACLALGVSKNDCVWTTPITFVASANCALYCGAKIDFVDIDPISYNLSAEKLEIKLNHAKKNGLPLPKVVIPVHLSGQSCEMDKIYALSKRFDFHIIEDASHAIGGRYKNAPIGNCMFSDITVFSFHPVKIVTTAEGGIAVTNNVKLAKSMELFRSHGITRDQELMVKPNNFQARGDWYYQQLVLGFNYRMTEMQAALGLSQMERLEEFVFKRNKIAEWYDNELADLPLVLPYQRQDTYSSRHLYIIRLKIDQLESSYSEIFSKLRGYGIGVNMHYIPVHTQPFYEDLGFHVGMFPEAELYSSASISIPLYHHMSSESQAKVVSALKAVLK